MDWILVAFAVVSDDSKFILIYKANDEENFMRKGLQNLYNYDLQNPNGGPFGNKRVHVTKMCIQTFIGELEGDGKICDDQNNAPGKQLDGNGDEVSCSKYIPRKFCHQQFFCRETK